MASAKPATRFWTALLTAILVVANLSVANLILRTYDLRWDLTADKRFEIGTGSQHILDGLEDTVSIKCYFSSNIPQTFSHLERILVEKLDEYEERSMGEDGEPKVIYEFVDPETDKTAKQECDDIGIAQVRVPDVEGVTSNRIVVCHMALVFRHGDRKVVLNIARIPSLDNAGRFAADLEYFLTKNIRNVSTDRMTVGVLAAVEMVPSNPRDPRSEKVKSQAINDLRNYIDRTHDVLMLDPAEINRGTPIPSEIDVLVAHKLTDTTEVGLFVLDQYLMHGGKALFLVDNGKVNIQPTTTQTQIGRQRANDYSAPTYRAELIDHKLDAFLAHYGLRVEQAFVQDDSCFEVSYFKDKEIARNAFGQVFIKPNFATGPYWSWPLVPARDEDDAIIDDDQLNAETAVVSPSDTVVFNWASPISILEENLERHDGRAVSLVKSGPRSWIAPIKDSVFSPAPDQRGLEAENRRADLAVMVNGRFRSFFKGREMPAPVGTAGQDLPVNPELGKNRRDESPDESTMMVIGDADFVEYTQLSVLAQMEAFRRKTRPNDPRAQKHARSNLYFVSNAVDVLCFGENSSDLFVLRNRTLESREIKKLEPDDPLKTEIDLINFAAIPSLIIALGLLRLVVRVFMARDAS